VDRAGSRTALGEPAPRGFQNHLVIARLEFEIPSSVWLSVFSRKHPDLSIDVNQTTPIAGNDILGEFEISGPAREWTREISRYPDVISVERLHVLPGPGWYRVRYRQPIYLAVAEKLEMQIRYPRIVVNGAFRCETIARGPEIRRLVRALRAAGCHPRIISLHGETFGPVRSLLTPVQRALFRQALDAGYFEVPRRTTLTELAKRVLRSKSSVSRTLAVVEQKIADFASRTIA
jgi:predicted DNA binding protein